MRHIVIGLVMFSGCFAQGADKKLVLRAAPTIQCPAAKTADPKTLKSDQQFVNLAAATAFVVDAINEAKCQNADPLGRFQLTTADMDFQTLIDSDGTLEVLFIGGLAGELDKQVTSDSDFTYSVPTAIGPTELDHKDLVARLSKTKTKTTPAKTLGEMIAAAIQQMSAGIGNLQALSQHQVKVSIKFAFTKDFTLELEPKIGSVGITGKFKKTDTRTQTLTLTFADQVPVINLSASVSAPVAPGTKISFYATVAPAANSTVAPTGDVTFFDNNQSLGTQILSNGFASIIVSNLSPGAHSITAAFGGDEHFDSTASTATVVIVNATGS